MGLGAKLWNGVKSVAKKTVEVASKAVDYVKEKTSKAWNGITGRTTFNEAEELLAEITDRYDKAKFEYERNMQDITSKLEERINTINYHKTDIYDKHFKRFTDLGNKLHNINIEGKSFLEYFEDSITEVKKLEGVRSKEELYMIDFNNLKASEIFFGIFTLGFFTRKKAKQTLVKVQEEEQRIDEEIEKMKSQVVKIKVILESIENVAMYFETLVMNYSKLLDRFEYGVSSQTQKQVLNGVTLENGKLDFKLIPIVHIDEFRALFNLSIVLKQMSTMGYLTENGEVQTEDIQAVNNIQSKMEKLELLSA
ncbi:DNA repair protein [Sulfurimonas lithotrophica]|uniref:DNA repair protein n=1 Tax=Sulfurimonas lithotrophica TaxID=2590022 RepID=A0A5P8P142_9BACT|nr:DNA repair protein [Sulfurimonas lithotrophica]QFR49384.1 DNA repair protein [Sulfurimonas lithotrophica]